MFASPVEFTAHPTDDVTGDAPVHRSDYYKLKEKYKLSVVVKVTTVKFTPNPTTNATTISTTNPPDYYKLKEKPNKRS